MKQGFLKDAPVKFLSHIHQNLRMFCECFLKSRRLFPQLSNFVTKKCKKKKKPKKKQFIAQSARADSVDIINFFYKQ